MKARGLVIKVGVVLAFCAIIIPFMLLCFYASPKLDDFKAIYYLSKTYPIGVLIWFDQQNGRFTHALLYCLPVNANVNIYRLTIFAVMCVFLHAPYYFNRSILKLKKWYAWAACLPFVVALLLYHPAVNQGFYWYGTTSHYILSLPLLLYILALYVHIDKSVSKVNNRLVFLQSVLVLALVGSNEMSAIVGLAITGVFMIYKQRTNGYAASIVLPFICASVGSMIQFILLRYSKFDTSQGFGLAWADIEHSLALSFNAFFWNYWHWLVEQHLWILIVLMIILVLMSRSSTIKLPVPSHLHLWLAISLFLSVFMIYFISYLYYFPGRALNFVIVIALAPIIIGAYCLGYQLKNRPIWNKTGLLILFGLLGTVLIWLSPNLGYAKELRSAFVLMSPEVSGEVDSWNPKPGVRLVYSRDHNNMRVYYDPEVVKIEELEITLVVGIEYGLEISPRRIEYNTHKYGEEYWFDYKVGLINAYDKEKMKVIVKSLDGKSLKKEFVQ